MNILALDPATKCGWAHSNGASGVWDLRIRPDESDGMRLIRLISKLNQIYQIAGVDLLVFEAMRFVRPEGRAAVVGGELQGTIKTWCNQRVPAIQYQGVSSREIKLHATGKGNAPKNTMLEAAWTRWGDLVIVDHNQADALWLLDLAMKDYAEAEAEA